MTIPIGPEITNLFSAAAKESLRSILVIRRGGIGDILMSTPALRMLVSRLPCARLDMLVQRGASDAVSGLPYVNAVYEVDSRSNPVSLTRLCKLSALLHGNKYDLLVNLQPGLKTNFLSFITRPRYSLMFDKDRSVQRETGRVRHAVDDFLHTLQPLGLGSTSDKALDFSVPDDARAALQRRLLYDGCEASGGDLPLIVINPTARRSVNRWREERWAELIDRLCASRSVRVAVIGAGRDLPTVGAVRALSAEWNQVVDLSGRITLKEVGALLEQAAVFITGDTGPMHVASAVGAPIVCLSGAADPDRTGPLTGNSLVLIDRLLPCVPCRNKRCRYSRRPRCMDGITVTQVYHAALRLITAKSRVPLSILKA